MEKRQFCVCIMTNASNTVLYTGVTNDLQRRVSEHQLGKGGYFSSKYKTTKLVWYECGGDVNEAIFREKHIKAGSRGKKVALINQRNPKWEDLAGKFTSVLPEDTTL
jgi:putative endonuclease